VNKKTPDIISTKNGDKEKMDIVLLDRSCPSDLNDKSIENAGARINITIWGDACQEFNYNIGQIMAIKRVRLGFFREAPQLSFGRESEVITNLKEREAAVLNKWY